MKGVNKMKYIMKCSNSVEVYNKAFAIYHDVERSESRAYNDMQKYLQEEVKAGRLDGTDKCIIASLILRDDSDEYYEEVEPLDVCWGLAE